MNKLMSKEEKLCAVCGLAGKCVGFSTICCKSCSVFYRRSYKLKHVLTCKREGNCNLKHELRNVCRSCRLQACRKLGLRMVGKNLIVQNNGYPADDIEEDEASTSKESVPNDPSGQNLTNQTETQQVSTSNFCPSVGEAFVEIRRFVKAFVDFENNQRLFSSIQQNKQIQAYESVYISKCQQFTMESATLKLIQQMIEQLLSDCDLNDEQMKAVFKNAPLQLATAHKAELTNRVFPMRGDTRVSFFVGYHLDINKLEHFLDNPRDFERMKKIAWNLIHKRYEAAERCRDIKPSTIEWCCFLGVLLFEELSRLGIQKETIIRRQNALYSEYFQYLLSIYHEASIVSTRMIKIVSFTHEISIVHEAHNDMYAIANIFLPRYEKTNWISKPEPDAANSSLNLTK
ncbi:hypothetical protein M3Y97_00786400 [Aphelenchoides bicaudatus]|nr:hypothetical protein M3Y97_00786400 [Aphelenchoides bicaudatus]